MGFCFCVPEQKTACFLKAASTAEWPLLDERADVWRGAQCLGMSWVFAACTRPSIFRSVRAFCKLAFVACMRNDCAISFIVCDAEVADQKELGL